MIWSRLGHYVTGSSGWTAAGYARAAQRQRSSSFMTMRAKPRTKTASAFAWTPKPAPHYLNRPRTDGPRNGAVGSGRAPVWDDDDLLCGWSYGCGFSTAAA